VFLIDALVRTFPKSLRSTVRKAIDLRKHVKKLLAPEQSFEEALQTLQPILDFLPLLVSFKDSEGHYKWVNRQYERTLGVSREEMIGKTADAFFVGDKKRETITRSLEIDQRVVDSLNPIYEQKFEFFLRGRRCVFQRTTLPILDKHGRLTEIFSVAKNITEQEVLEEALREHEEQLRMLLEAAGEGIYGLDLGGKAIFMNAAVARMVGYSPNEFIGQKVHSLIHHSHPDGSSYPVEECPMYAAFRDGTTQHTEDEILWRKDGTSFPVEYISRPLRKNGALVGAVVTFNDISERKASERELRDKEVRLQAILDNVTDGVVTINEHGIVETINHSAEIMFGHSVDQICGQNVSVLMPEPYHSEHDGYIESYLRTGKGKIIDVGAQEVVGLDKNGRRFPLELSISVMHMNGRRLFIGVLRDITLRKQAEYQLRQSQKMEAMGQLTGGIAHDFNNLLQAILGNLELAQRRIPDDDKLVRFLDVARKASLRGADLTQRLLAFSRKQTLEPEMVDVNKLVANMAELIQQTLGEDIEIETVLAGGLWKILVDLGQLENVILNLAINARDAMPEGGKLTIETLNTRLDQAYAGAHEEVNPGQYVMIGVTDTGIGMSPEVIEHAFDPFYTTKAQGKGTGLGLSMSHGFIKQSGGHIKIYSEAGEGTTVKLYLPRIMGGARSPRIVEMPESTERMGNETIFVVEDDPDVRFFVVNALSINGYHILEAEDGPAAIALLDKESISHIDLLLTDVVLPHGMNGRQVAEEIQKRFPKIKVLFTSGYTENAIVHQGKLDEDAELLAKPYTRETLSRKVRAALDD